MEQAALPVVLVLPFHPRLTVDVTTAAAYTRVISNDSTESEIVGSTDTQIRADWQLMLDHLVGYLHSALPDMRSVSSTVERELALAGDYLSIMRIRMGERLRFRIDADAAVRALPFPPAMLISLVENAVKHGLESATRAGDLLISAAVDGDTLRVAVRDNGAGLSDQPGQGFGLANIQERLQLLYGGRAALTVAAPEDGGVEATLSVPLPAREPA